jgi:hypothetical protein
MRTRDRTDQPSPPSTPAKKAKRGPRAIAVVEFLPNGAMRLVPVALWIEGKYYDASLYGANPAPMALEPETVYEAQSFGEPTGTFTITSPQQVNGNWVADGTWQPELPMDTQMKAKAAKDAAQRAKNPPSEAVMTGDADSGRPVLKRAPGSGGDTGSSGQASSSGGSGSSSSGSSGSKTSSSGDSDRPTMKRPASDSSGKPTLGPSDDSSDGSSSSANSGGSANSDRPVMKRAGSDSSTSTAQADDNDPNRPVMKHPAATSGPTDISPASSSSNGVTQAAAASDDRDPNRPTLSRTKTYKPQAGTSSDATTTAPTAGKTSSSPTVTAKSMRAYPAISDAGTYQSRPLIYTMSSGERQGFEQTALKLAMDEIRAFAAKHNGPLVPKNATITDYDARAFDLEYSSSPTVVLSAKLPMPSAKGVPPDFTYFATVVARIDINDQAQKIFSMVTDSKHLDAYPRMELIDAVDADANGRGDLLFRQYSDVGISYGLYRVSPYQIEKIFEGGSSL